MRARHTARRAQTVFAAARMRRIGGNDVNDSGGDIDRAETLRQDLHAVPHVHHEALGQVAADVTTGFPEDGVAGAERFGDFSKSCQVPDVASGAGPPGPESSHDFHPRPDPLV
ncbi:hypothetical protein GCM10027610_091280 [Dactylosporangium cerinum]